MACSPRSSSSVTPTISSSGPLGATVLRPIRSRTLACGLRGSPRRGPRSEELPGRGVSLWRAELSGVWSFRKGDDPPPVPERLDVARVSKLHEGQHVGGIGDAVSRVGAVVGVDVHPDSVALPRTLRQADGATSHLIQEWNASTGGCEACGSRRRRPRLGGAPDAADAAGRASRHPIGSAYVRRPRR